jgi:hypothetical protein
MEITVSARDSNELLASIDYNEETGTVEFIEHDSVRVDIDGANGRPMLRLIDIGKPTKHVETKR